MYRRVTSVNEVLRSRGPVTVIRSVAALLAKRRNSTNVAAAQEVPEEWSTAKPYEQMPGPKPLPLIGNIWRFMPNIGDWPTDMPEQLEYFNKKYGSIVKVGGLLIRNDMVMLYDPDEIEKVYRHEGPWPVRGGTKCLTYYRNVTRKDIFEGVGGTLVHQGEEWQKFRSKVNPTMMQPRSTKLYVAPIDAVAKDFINRIRGLRDEKQEMPADFSNELCRWALESIVFIALDTRLGCLRGDLDPDSEPQKLINAVETLFDCMYKLEVMPSPWQTISTPAWRKFVKASDTATEMALKYINQATERLKAMPEDSDRELTVLEKLLAQDPNPKTAVVMAVDMMMAGVDTTSSAVSIALYYLAKNPDKQQKLFEEIHRHLPDKGQPITSDILNDLKYMKACIKESMRLNPIAIAMIRTLTKDMVLSDYRIPKGTEVIMPTFYLCNQEKYCAQADKYIPERWLKSPEGNSPETKMTHPFVFIPFGFGPRMCVGRRFAELELDTLVTRIIRNFHVEYNYGDMKFQCKLLNTPVSPLKFKFVDRE